MAGKRIKSLTESNTVADSDVIAFDNSALTEANKVTKLNFLKEIQLEVDGKEESGVASALVANHEASTVYNHLTSAEKIVVGNTLGTNTGDETSVSIKTKLGITTLSGSNTGDNATNTQYSGLEASKLDKTTYPITRWSPTVTYLVGDVVYQDQTGGYCFIFVAISSSLNENPSDEFGSWSYVPSVAFPDNSNGIVTFSSKFATKKNKLSTVTVVTDTYAILSTDEIVVCNKATAFTVTLPTAVVGQSFDIKNIGAGTVLLEGAGTDTIDDSLNKEILQWTNLKVVCYSNNKWIVV